jgi:hypothetical protein
MNPHPSRRIRSLRLRRVLTHVAASAISAALIGFALSSIVRVVH